MSSPWEDRRGIFQTGKHVHEPGKQMPDFGTRKQSIGGGIADAVRRSSTSSSDGMEKTASASSGSPARRRSSAASGGLFGNLNQHKRGSEDYAARRASHTEQHPGGLMSGWFNSTFRGSVSKPDPSDQTERKGVME